MRMTCACALVLAAVLGMAPVHAGAPTAGLAGAALSFDGVDDFVSVPNFGTYAPTTEITVEFWQKVSAIRGQMTFTLNPDNGNNRILAHVPWSNGVVYWDFGDSATTGRLQYTPPGGGGVLVNTWQHLAMVASQSGDYMRIYRNGVLEAEKAGMEPFDQYPADLQIGGIATMYFGGEMDEFRIWNIARSQAEIQAAMNTPLAGNEPGLVLLLRFDESSGLTAFDGGPGAHNGTLQNGITRLASAAPINEIHVVTGVDQVITLAGFDPGGAALTAEITGLPTTGTLYQYNGGVRGAEITGALPIAVTDAGRRVIYADGAGGDSFRYLVTTGAVDSADATVTIRGLQTITFNALPNKNEGDPPFQLTATASSGLPVTYTVLSGPASITAPDTVTLTGFGANVTLRASQPGDADYLPAAPVDQAFYVNAEPVVTLGQGALRFDGADDVVSVPNFGTYAPTTEITVEFWQKVSAVTWQAAFSLNPDDGNNRLLVTTPWGNGVIYWDFGDLWGGGRLEYTPPGGGNILVNTWQHFALVASQSGNYMRIYRNGVLEAEKAGMEPFDQFAAALQIGGVTGMYFGGDMDEFRIWNVARSQAEIQATMNKAVGAAEPNLFFCAHFDEAAGGIATDTSPGGHDGTLLNGVTRIASLAPINSLQIDNIAASSDTVLSARQTIIQ